MAYNLMEMFPYLNFEDYSKGAVDIVIDYGDTQVTQGWQALYYVIENEVADMPIGSGVDAYFMDKKDFDTFLIRLGVGNDIIKLYGHSGETQGSIYKSDRYCISGDSFVKITLVIDENTDITKVTLQRISIDEYLSSITDSELCLEDSVGYGNLQRFDSFNQAVDKVRSRDKNRAEQDLGTELDEIGF